MAHRASKREAIGDELAELLLQEIRGLYRDVHRSQPDPSVVSLDASLDRDLGFDSLTRVELLLRLERAGGGRLPETALASAETVRDLLLMLRAAPEAQPPRPAPPRKQGEARPIHGSPDRTATLAEAFLWHVARHPERAPVTVLEGEAANELSYEELHRGAQAVAGGLQQHRVNPGETVALMLPTGADYFRTFLGVVLAGAIPVPVYPPARPAQLAEHVRRLRQILVNASAVALITVPEARTIARLLRAEVPSIRHVFSPGELLAARSPCTAVPATAQAIALIQYTSGSTGAPKGVVLTHANLLANIRAMGAAIRVGESDVFVSWLPLYHDMGLIGAWLGTMYFGCQLVVMPPTAFLTRPAEWLWAIHRHRATLSAAPNFAYELCARRIDEREIEGLDLGSWRVAFNGSEAVLPTTLERFARRFAGHGFDARALTPVYGLAESAVGLTFPPIGRGPLIDTVDAEQLARSGRAVPAAPGARRTARFVSCGTPLPGHQVRIVDVGGTEAGERVEGVLQFAGPSATPGYFRNAEATRLLLRGEWHDSGDRAYTAGGELYITGRVKDTIIRRGFNIHPEDLEDAVGAVPGIRQGCVAIFGSTDPDAASERLIVVAETRQTDPESLAALRALVVRAVVERLGEPPDEVVLAPSRTVLKTSSGKLRRAATRSAFESGTLTRRRPGPAWQLAMLRMAAIAPGAGRWLRVLRQLLYGAYAWSLFALVATPVWVLTAATRDTRRAWGIAHAGARALIHGWRIPFTVRGTEHLAPSGAHVLVANHASYLDALFLLAMLAQPHAFVAKIELERSFLTRTFLARLGAVFVERSAMHAGRADIERLSACVRHGRSLAVFPEGTFDRMAGLRPFYLGAFEVAAATGAPVLPVALRGTRALLRDGQWRLRRQAVTAEIGGPIAPPHGADDPFTQSQLLRDVARDHILRYCNEPDRGSGR